MITTRPMEARDRPGILAVAAALPEWFDKDARERAIPADIRHQDGFVALSQDEIVGFITLFVAEGRLNIGWLGVEPKHHHAGIGSRLLEAAEEFGRRHELTELATFTLGDGVDYKPYEVTREFYFRRGFTVYQRSTTDNPGCPEEIRIRKRIAQD
jgi:GNAT superfamily N-acetyltransferase